MSDHFPAQIWIGGKVSNTTLLCTDDPFSPSYSHATTVFQGLIAALHEDGASHAYGDRAIAVDCTNWDDLALYLDDESLLHLKDDQAHNGEFGVTERFCIDNNITFDRNSDHYMEYDGENVHWRPGMSEPQVTLSDSRGKEIVDGDTVRKALELLDAVVDPASEADASTVFHEARRFLHDACPELPPKLEKFEIVS